MSQPVFDEYGQIVPANSSGNPSPAHQTGEGFRPVLPHPAPVFNEFGELVNLAPQPTPPSQPWLQSPIPPASVPVERRSRAIYWLIGGVVAALLLAAGVLGWFVLFKPDPGPTPDGTGPLQATLAEMDKLYTGGQAALASEQFKTAVTNFEQLREKQRQLGFQRYNDGNLLLFRSYVGAGQELAVSSRELKEVEQSLNYFKKAVQLVPEIPAGQREAQREAFVKQQIEYGELYYQGRVALEGGRLDEAIDALGRLYAKTQNFRDGAAVYYNALTAQGDLLLKDNRPEQAYTYFAVAAKLANVPDNNNYARLRLSGIESQLKKAGKPVPTVRAAP